MITDLQKRLLAAQTEVGSIMKALVERNMALEAALEGMVNEFEKMTKYGSPLALAANENLQRAKRLLMR